ncbi:hypothetical protein MNBD_BACTEROID01-2760 [hydrothermal vent metagenome]|uniref:4Fe-4S ferredoxin-type domain-containing protein n=1 Tax=hydrothermal vent metagenome TaxID=652676 RepID=A0A3B0TXD7_9ZZZZ
MYDLPIDLLISPVAVGYFLFGRFALAKTFVASHKCNNCGLCTKQCPVSAIRFVQNHPFWSHKCESCMHCMNICPQRAIETAHLATGILWWFVFSFIPVLIAGLFIKEGNFIDTYFTLIVWTIMFITGLPIIFFGYKILHFFMQYKFLNYLITYTSLTRFKFWRRYFAPKKYL